MKKLSPLPFFLLALLAVTEAASAQAVSFRGKVENVPGTANQFVVDCTDTQLASPTIALNAFAGQQVTIGGLWNGSATSPSVLVQTIAIVPRTFEIGGNGSIGGVARFRAFGATGDAALLVAAAQPSFLPFPGTGVVFLDVQVLAVLGTGPIGPNGNFEIVVPVPNEPAFVGATVLGQGAIFGPTAGLVVSNPDCKTIQS